IFYVFFFSSRRRHTRWPRDWSSDVCSSDLELDGEKLHGGWNLVRSGSGKYGGDKSWLLFKESDDFARLGPEALITEDRPESVLKIGRASCRERVSISVVEVSVKKKEIEDKQ